MSKFIPLTFAAVFWLFPLGAGATALSPDESAFVNKHLSDVVQIEPTRLDNPALLKVFSTPFYNVKIVIHQGGGTQTQDVMLARVDSHLVSVSAPNTDMDVPELVKMIAPTFKLSSDDDAKTLQEALDVAYPIMQSDDQKAKTFVHKGNQWTFIRGKFFDHHRGYMFQTDAKGAVTSIKYSLHLP